MSHSNKKVSNLPPNPDSKSEQTSTKNRIKPPYDSEANRAQYSVKTEGSITIINRKPDLSELLTKLKSALCFKLDRVFLRQLWKFFCEVYWVSPLHFNIQLVGKVVERFASFFTGCDGVAWWVADHDMMQLVTLGDPILHIQVDGSSL